MRTFVLAAFFSILASGCDGDGMARPGPDSGVPPTETFGQMTAADVGLLCDWTAGCFGGYGRTMSCSGGSITMSSAKSREDCVSNWGKSTSSECASMTVGGYQNCVYNLKCPLLWMDSDCSVLADCVMSMM